MKTKTGLVIKPELHSRLSMGQWPHGLNQTLAVPMAAMTGRVVTQEEMSQDGILKASEVVGNLGSRLGKMFDVEVEAKKIMERRLRGAELELRIREQATVINMPVLDPSFLSWKRSDLLPIFAVYSLSSPLAKIRFSAMDLSIAMNVVNRRLGHVDGNFEVDPPLPRCITDYYLDFGLRSTMGSLCVGEGASIIEISALYSGTMPEEICDRIEQTKHLFENVFIIAHAPEWKIDVVARIAGDPLVVGVKDGILWLIGSYDLTPTEELVQTLCLRNGSIHTMN
jgi:hypothetical protein